MRPNTLRHLHRDGRTIVNGWLSINSPYLAELAAHQGYDALTVDMQHGMIGFDGAVAMFQAIATTPVIPMARPSENSPAEIMRLLDAGAYGIICPMISTASDAARLVAACRYPPVGARSFGPARGLLYGGLDYFTAANTEILVFAMIETQGALDNLDAIASTEGIDGVFIGPADLSASMGHVGNPGHPNVQAAIEGAIRRINLAGKAAGILTPDEALARHYLGLGALFVAVGLDTALLARHTSALASRFKGAVAAPAPASGKVY